MRRRWRAGLLAGIGLMVALAIGGRADPAAAVGPSLLEAIARDLMQATFNQWKQQAEQIRRQSEIDSANQIFPGLGDLWFGGATSGGAPSFAEETETPVQKATKDVFAGLNANANTPFGGRTFLSPDFQIGIIGGVQHLSNSGDIGNEQLLA